MRSLRGRLIFSHILPILIILPVMGLGLLSVLRSQILLTNLSKELVDQAQLAAMFLTETPEVWYDPGRAEAVIEQISPSLLAQITLLDSEGRVMASSNPTNRGKIGQVALKTTEPPQTGMQITYSPNQSGEVSEILIPVSTRGGILVGYIQLSNPFLDLDTGFQQLRQLILIILGGGLLAGLVMGSVLAVQLERPLKRTTQAVNQLANGEQLSPLPESGPQEIRTLLHAFNSLVDRLHGLEASRRQLLANLVHELGRPLGAMQSGVDALLHGADEDITLRKELLEGIRDELGRLRGLLNELASLHDQVLGNLELNRQPVNLENWLGRVLAPWREAAQEKGQRWAVQFEPGLPEVALDQDRFGQAIGNLLSNAVQYTPQGGEISIFVGQTGRQLRIDVDDSGPGIGPEEQEKIFTPFFRGRAARRFSNGMGLGLSITKDIVCAHGGEISADNRAGHGSRFTILLPLGEDPEPA
jgi:signal transduction histidine kinase